MRTQELAFKAKKYSDVDQDFFSVLSKVATKLNSEHVLKQCEKNAEKYSDPLESMSSITTEQLIEAIDPTIWNFLVLLTQSKREKQRMKEMKWNEHYTDFSKSNSDIGQNRRTSKLLFLAYSLLFNTSDVCGFPLHIMVTDLVDCYSSSDTLLNLLCKLGITVSSSTHKRFVQGIIEASDDAGGPSRNLIDGAFTVVTIDNLDKLFSKTVVRTGETTRCWNGTTVAAYNPKPISLKQDIDENLSFRDIAEHAYVLPFDQSESAQVVVVTSDHQYTENKRTVDQLIESEKSKRPTARSRREAGKSTIIKLEKHNPNVQPLTNAKTYSVAIADTTEEGTYAWNKFKSKVFWYINERSVCPDKEMHVPGIKCKFFIDDSEMHHYSTEKSNIVYLSVVNAHADKIETMKHVIDQLDLELHKEKSISHLVVGGDAKTYEHLIALKREYGSELDWMLPFIGDFHILMNYQSVLMKIFWDAGLSSIGKILHSSNTYTSLQSTSDFRRTHAFFLQTWEALFRIQIQQFFEWRSNQNHDQLKVALANEQIKDKLKEVIDSLSLAKMEGYQDVSEFIRRQESLTNELKNFENEFAEFRSDSCKEDETFKFWDSFIHQDCLYYIGLWMSTRCGDWELRMHCIKAMVPLFNITDRLNYAKLLPQHLAEISSYPEEIVEYFKEGGFVISLKGVPYASLAFDEAHESTINKEVKMAMSKGDQDNIVSLAKYLPFHGVMLENFKFLLSHKSNITFHEELSCKFINNANICEYRNYIFEKASIFPSVLIKRSLMHIFSGSIASEEQICDLMTYHEAGLNRVKSYVQYNFSKSTSTKLHFVKKNLKTFEVKQTTVAKMKSINNDQKLICSYWKRLASHSKITEEPISDIGQYLELPSAFALPNGLPYSASKCSTTQFYQNRYSGNVKDLFSDKLDHSKYECAILEGMFLLNTSPLGSCTTYLEYGEFFLRRWIETYFRLGYSEVHVIFDDCANTEIGPKDIERRKRDDKSNTAKDILVIEEQSHLPGKDWMMFLSNRHNKSLLCNFLSLHIANYGHAKCQSGQAIVVSGGFLGSMKNKAIYVNNVSCKYLPELHSNHEETDSRLWLHVRSSELSSFLIYSPDTDVYHIGLPLCTDKDVVMKINAKQAADERFLHMTKLRNSFNNDIELQAISNKDRYLYIQKIFISSGCDYVSFFRGLGKNKFFSATLKYSHFILYGLCNKDVRAVGHFLDAPPSTCQSCVNTKMCDNCAEKVQSSLMGFYRLIGCLYFLKFRNAFTEFSPVENFINFESNSSLSCRYQIQTEWLESIRIKTIERSDYEEGSMPSVDALRRHWLRSTYVSLLWQQASCRHVVMPHLELYGWNIVDGVLYCDWDSPENIFKVKDRVAFVTKGCSCKTGCTQQKCSCKKASKLCGPGCKCLGCKNKRIVPVSSDLVIETQI